MSRKKTSSYGVLTYCPGVVAVYPATFRNKGFFWKALLLGPCVHVDHLLRAKCEACDVASALGRGRNRCVEEGLFDEGEEIWASEEEGVMWAGNRRR